MVDLQPKRIPNYPTRDLPLHWAAPAPQQTSPCLAVYVYLVRYGPPKCKTVAPKVNSLGIAMKAVEQTDAVGQLEPADVALAELVSTLSPSELFPVGARVEYFMKDTWK